MSLSYISIASRRLPLVGAAMTGLLAIAACGPQPVVLTLTPAPIAAMHDGNPVAVKGQVAEIFGNKFIIQDSSGRALVETGPKGDQGNLVAKSENVTVQGRFDHGFIHAQLITRADGTNELVGPPGPPDRGPRPPHGPADCPTPGPAHGPDADPVPAPPASDAK